jgi:uncharacterized membrane protein
MSNNTLGSLSHLTGFLFGAIAPLIIYLTTSDEFTRNHAYESVKWQTVVSLLFIGCFFFLPNLLILPAVLLLFSLNTVLPFIGMVKAAEDDNWSYPLLSLEDRTEMSNNEQEIDRIKRKYLDGEITDDEFEKEIDKVFSDERRDRELSRTTNK